MSQSKAKKLSIISVILTIAVVVLAQRSTDSNSEITSQQNIDRTEVSKSAIAQGSVQSPTERAIAEPSTQPSVEVSATFADSHLQLIELSDEFQKLLQQYLEISPSFKPRLKLEQHNFHRQMQPVSADKIKPESDSNNVPDYLAVFNLNQPLNDLQSFQPAVKRPHPAQSEALFLSLISANTTAWKFFVDRSDRILLQDVNHSETTEVNSPSGQKPKATILTPAQISQPLKTVAVKLKSLQSSGNVAAKTATDPTPTTSSVETLLFDLFRTPDSPGALAIGAAEGTRTTSGQVTSSYWGHSDPGNGLHNMGTFSYQHGAASPRQADWRQLKRLQGQVKKIIKQAEEKGVTLSALDLVAGADLLNQSPAAGMSYVHNLKKARDRGLKGMYAVLDARVMSFVNPKTGALEAGGFGNSWEVLRKDQWRRLNKLNKTLQYHDII